MVPSLIELASIGIASFTLIISLTLFHLARKRMVELESHLADIAERQKELMAIEQNVMERNPTYEDFERTVSNLSERLFQLVRDRYDLEGVTTYDEIIDALQNLNSDDNVVDDLVDFFKYLEKIEYSDDEISREDKAMIRQSAFTLLRRAGSSLTEAKLRTGEE